MKNIMFFLVILCTLIISGSLLSETIGQTDQEVKAIAEPLLENVMDALKNDDYAKYTKDFDLTLKEAVQEQRFHEISFQIKNGLGSYQSKEYLGFLDKGQTTLVLFRGKFDKSQSDVLIKLVVTKKEGKYYISGLWFE